MEQKDRAIICVDDEDIVLKSLEAMLRRTLGKDFQFEFAQSGNEALELIEEMKNTYSISVIISDWMMPEMLGDELLTRVKSIDSEVKTIILSGQMEHQAKQQAKSDQTIDHFLEKPWDERELIECILT